MNKIFPLPSTGATVTGGAGGASGFGAGIANQFLVDGARVMIADCTPETHV